MGLELVPELCGHQQQLAFPPSEGPAVTPLPLLTALFFLFFFAVLEAWFMDLNSCFQGGLARSWYCPFSGHVRVGPARVLCSQGSWCVSLTITFLVTLEKKTGFGVGYGGEFQAIAVEDRNRACHSIQTALQWALEGHRGLLTRLWVFDGQEL